MEDDNLESAYLDNQSNDSLSQTLSQNEIYQNEIYQNEISQNELPHSVLSEEIQKYSHVSESIPVPVYESEHEHVSDHVREYIQEHNTIESELEQEHLRRQMQWRRYNARTQYNPCYNDKPLLNICFICKQVNYEIVYPPCNCGDKVSHNTCMYEYITAKKYCCIQRNSKTCKQCHIEFRINLNDLQKELNKTFTFTVILKYLTFIACVFSCVGITYEKDVLTYINVDIHTTYKPILVEIATISILLFFYLIWFIVYILTFNLFLHVIFIITAINIILAHTIVVGILTYMYTTLLWNIQTFIIALILYTGLHVFISISAFVLYLVYKCLILCKRVHYT